LLRTRRLWRKFRMIWLKMAWGLSGQKIRIGRGTSVEFGAILRCHRGGSITIGNRCHIHKGAQILSYGGDIIIGDKFTLNPYAILYGHGGLQIGDNVLIAAHTVIIPANHVFERADIPIKAQGLTKEGIRIGSDVWLGNGVSVLDGVTIGDGSVIGAGAVLTKSTSPYGLYVGVPARRVRDRT